MPRKWRNRIITRCYSNVNVAISISKTLLQLDLVTSIQRVVQCCHLASPNLKNSHVSYNNFHAPRTVPPVPSWQVMGSTLLHSTLDKHFIFYSAFHMRFEVLTIVNTLKKEAVVSTKMLVSIYLTAHCHVHKICVMMS